MVERKEGRTWGRLDNLAECGDRCTERRGEEYTCCIEGRFVVIVVR